MGAPPRPGTAKYDEFMQERERKRGSALTLPSITIVPSGIDLLRMHDRFVHESDSRVARSEWA